MGHNEMKYEYGDSPVNLAKRIVSEKCFFLAMKWRARTSPRRKEGEMATLMIKHPAHSVGQEFPDTLKRSTGKHCKWR